MDDLYKVEEHGTFSVAAFVARGIAKQYGEPVGVERSTIGWAVFVTSAVLCSIALHERKVEGPEDEIDEDSFASSDDDQELLQEDDRAERIEEFLDYQDSFARSEEEGWYYGD